MPHIRVVSNYGEICRPDVRAAWQSLLHRCSGEVLFYQTPSYFDHLAHRDGNGALSLALIQENTTILGVVPLWVTDAALEFRAGSMRFGALTFQCLRILGGGLLLPQSPELFRLVFRELATAFPRCSAIEIKGLPTSSDLWRYLASSSVKDDFVAYVPHGARLCHWAELPASFDRYMAGFKRKKRYNLKRQLARLEQHSGGTLSLCRIEGPHDVPILTHALDRLGPQRRGGKLSMTPREIADLADRNLLRSYVLMTGEGPASLAFGTTFGATQLIHMFAHERRIEHLSPGTVLQTLMMRDLIEAGLARRIDYGFGEPRYRLGNQVEERVSVMLARRTLLARSGFLAHATFDGLLSAVKKVSSRQPDSMHGSDSGEEPTRAVAQRSQIGRLFVRPRAG